MDNNTERISTSTEELEQAAPFRVTNDFLAKRPLSASSLKHFRESPKHYIHYITEKRVDKPEWALGRLVECMILEPEKLDKKYCFPTMEKPNMSYTTKLAKEIAEWNKIIETAVLNKQTVIDPDMQKLARKMADSALQTEETRYYIDRIAKFKNGRKVIQEKLEWVDKKTKLPIIGYLDFKAEIEGTEIIIDIKTDKDGNPDDFNRGAINKDYQVQVGAYLEGYRNKYFSFPEFMFMVIEKVKPYDAIMMHCDQKFIEASKAEFNHLLTSFRYCMDNDLFHKGRAFWRPEGMNYFNMEIPRYKKMRLPIDE